MIWIPVRWIIKSLCHLIRFCGFIYTNCRDGNVSRRWSLYCTLRQICVCIESTSNDSSCRTDQFTSNFVTNKLNVVLTCFWNLRHVLPSSFGWPRFCWICCWFRSRGSEQRTHHHCSHWSWLSCCLHHCYCLLQKSLPQPPPNTPTTITRFLLASFCSFVHRRPPGRALIRTALPYVSLNIYEMFRLNIY